MLEALDGPSKQYTIAVGTATPLEVEDGGSPLEGRKVITMQGDGRFYVYFADEGQTPNAATVSTDGFLHYKNAKTTYEASASQVVFILAVTGTVNVKIAERG